MAKMGSKVAQAYQRCHVARMALMEVNAREMECTEDRAGIVWMRYVLPTGESLLLFATPSWWDVYVPLCKDTETFKVIAAIEARAGRTKEQQAQEAALRG